MKFTIILTVCLMFMISSALADVTDTKEYNYELKPGGRISLSNVNGDVHIVGTGGNQVHITATRKAGTQEYLDGMSIEVKATDDLIRIETHYPKSEGSWFHHGGNSKGSVTYDLEVPAKTRLDSIETVNGSVKVTGVKGPVNVETVNGKMSLAGLADDAKLTTVNGTIDARFDVLGSVQHVKAEAVNGRIVVAMPEKTSAQIHAETVNGSIDADDFGLKPDKGFIGRDLDGKIGAGEAQVHVDTVNGSVTFQRQRNK